MCYTELNPCLNQLQKRRRFVMARVPEEALEALGGWHFCWQDKVSKRKPLPKLLACFFNKSVNNGK